MSLKELTALVALVVLSTVTQALADQTKSSDPQTGAETWEIQKSGVTLSLKQLLPDQVRAFYINRGFSLRQIDPYATSCVYTVVLRNDNAPGIVHFTLKNWSIVSDGYQQPPMDTGNWLQQLQQAGSKKPALIAFRWAQLPPEHNYEPNGDWNQGMLAAGLHKGSSFDLVARWDVDGKPYQIELRGVRCVQ